MDSSYVGNMSIAEIKKAYKDGIAATSLNNIEDVFKVKKMMEIEDYYWRLEFDERELAMEELQEIDEKNWKIMKERKSKGILSEDEKKRYEEMSKRRGEE